MTDKESAAAADAMQDLAEWINIGLSKEAAHHRPTTQEQIINDLDYLDDVIG